jgi:MoxR-like ATPase
MDVEAAATLADEIVEQVRSAVVTDREVVETLLVGLLARGHVLIEDVPGTGKTLAARSLADALGLSFNRIQFTPDLLPADVTGSNVYRENTGRFEFVPGPLFDNVVLADELNRAPPKTQAALLEAMEEGQVSVDGETHDLPEPFVVVATQNPVEQEGTFSLPEAERDRFVVQTELGYPDLDGERELLDQRAERTTITPSVSAVTDTAEVRNLRQAPETVHVAEEIRDYIIAIARETRSDDRVDLGASPRAVQRFFEAARARACLSGRSYVVPDDVKRVAPAVLAHRLVVTTEARVEGVEPGRVVERALSTVEVPAVTGKPGADAAGGVTGDTVESGPDEETPGGAEAGGSDGSGRGAAQGNSSAPGDDG